MDERAGHLIVNDIHRLYDECGLSDDNIHWLLLAVEIRRLRNAFLN